MPEAGFVPYTPTRVPENEMLRRGREFLDLMAARRSVRAFSTDPVPRELVELAIRAAATAPSGANRQPWRFAAVADPEIKRRIRIGAEEEERRNYEGGRMPPDWIEALRPLGTGWRKPFLEEAPWLVVVFEERHGPRADGSIRKNYYVRESVGIACGLFVAAVHRMGLATLTHTPSPMGFLGEILRRPRHETPFLLFPIGYPAADCQVPDIARKPIDEVAIWAV
jgi:nitroreductase